MNSNNKTIAVAYVIKIIGIFLLYIAMAISLITGFQYLLFTYKNMNNNN